VIEIDPLQPFLSDRAMSALKVLSYGVIKLNVGHQLGKLRAHIENTVGLG